jgi:hypothetical protein
MKEFTINLSALSTPRDICHIMEMLNVKHFTYTFSTKNEIIKEGKASDNEWASGTWGNRIYRQAGGIPGWNSNSLDDSSAKKMNVQMKQHFPAISKNDVSITVHDYTFELENEPQYEINRVLLNDENARVQKHINDVGVPPKLNIQKTRHRKRPMFSELFGDDE